MNLSTVKWAQWDKTQSNVHIANDNVPHCQQLSTDQAADWSAAASLGLWLTELQIHVQLDTKETFPKTISWLGVEKLNLTEQKHAFTNQTKCTTTQNKHKLEMRANAQRDGRPAEHRWRPLFNAAKFGW